MTILDGVLAGLAAGVAIYLIVHDAHRRRRLAVLPVPVNRKARR